MNSSCVIKVLAKQDFHIKMMCLFNHLTMFSTGLRVASLKSKGCLACIGFLYFIVFNAFARNQ